MTDTPAEVVESTRPPRRSRRQWRRLAVVLTVLLLLFGVPAWTVLAPGAAWPPAVTVIGVVLFAAAFVALPLAMYLGHGRRHRDSAAVAGDVLLGAAWVLFVWSVLGQLLNLVLALTGVVDPLRSRVVAGFVVAVVVALLVWGYAEAMRVPRVRRVDVTIARLGRGLDGLRVALITDTHYGPIDRARWSAGVVARSTSSTPTSSATPATSPTARSTQRREQARPLASVTCAPTARVYVTGNHEYFSEAQGWLDHMESSAGRRCTTGTLWSSAAATASSSPAWTTPPPSRPASPATAPTSPRRLPAPTATLPVLLLAHQPKQVATRSRDGRRPADLRSHPRRPDLAVPLPGPARPAGGAGPQPARRADPALHEPRHRVLGPAVPGLRAQRDHAADPSPPVGPRRSSVEPDQQDRAVIEGDAQRVLRDDMTTGTTALHEAEQAEDEAACGMRG